MTEWTEVPQCKSCADRGCESYTAGKFISHFAIVCWFFNRAVEYKYINIAFSGFGIKRTAIAFCYKNEQLILAVKFSILFVSLK